MKSQQIFVSTGSLLVRLWRHLSERRRLQFAWLLGLMLVSAFTEMVSLGAVLPFLGVLTSPERVFALPLVSKFSLIFGITSPDELVLPLTIAFAVAALFAGAMRLLVLWIGTRLAYASGADLSIDMYRRTLYQPYRVHVARNSSEVISGITGKVGAAINVIYQLLVLVSSTVLMGAVLIAILVINTGVALLAAVGFGICYACLTFLSRHWLRRNSQRIANEQTQLFKSLQEGLGGIRDVLLDGTQSIYCDAYTKADQPLRRAQADNSFITGSPRFAMEAVGMVLIAALTYSLSTRDGGVSAALPILGALALAAQRLLPALQQIYSAWATIVGSHSSLGDVVDLLDQPISAEWLQPIPEPLVVKSAICLNSVYFRYVDEGAWILNDVNLVIPKGAKVGFVGATGSGKSTILDVLMALLEPTGGGLFVDGQKICGDKIRAWQQTIAHVPQSIYLADASLAENIAFGVPRNQIDMARVKLAARQAQIAEFAESTLNNYEASVGERGIRLSGGQRQRIGIARALYKRSSVLILDEATSALDNSTEQSVMDAINALDENLTVLIVAHRLSTVKRCDMLVEFSEGRVIAKGTYEQLLESSGTFRMMAREVV